MIYNKYNKEQLEALVEKSSTFVELASNMGYKTCKKSRLISLLEKFNIDYSILKSKIPQPIENKNDFYNPTTKLQNQIVILRKKGLSFLEISKQLNCSKSSVSYTLRKLQKIKTKNRRDNTPHWLIILSKKIDTFKRKEKKRTITKGKDWKMKLRGSVSKFSNKKGNKVMLGYKDVLNKYNGKYIVTDYITGDIIDITKDDYCLDHIIPSSKGGLNTLDNLAIVTPKTNKVKSDLTVEELIAFSKKILENNGYSVTKIL